MEKVMVVPTELLEAHLTSKSFITENIPHIMDIIRENHLYVSREYAEYAAEYKQLSYRPCLSPYSERKHPGAGNL